MHKTRTIIHAFVMHIDDEDPQADYVFLYGVASAPNKALGLKPGDFVFIPCRRDEATSIDEPGPSRLVCGDNIETDYGPLPLVLRPTFDDRAEPKGTAVTEMRYYLRDKFGVDPFSRRPLPPLNITEALQSWAGIGRFKSQPAFPDKETFQKAAGELADMILKPVRHEKNRLLPHTVLGQPSQVKASTARRTGLSGNHVA